MKKILLVMFFASFGVNSFANNSNSLNSSHNSIKSSLVKPIKISLKKSKKVLLECRTEIICNHTCCVCDDEDWAFFISEFCRDLPNN